MLLAIDIGNSSIKFGFFQDEKLKYNFSLKSSPKISSQKYFLQIQQLSERNPRPPLKIISLLQQQTEMLLQLPIMTYPLQMQWQIMI